MHSRCFLATYRPIVLTAAGRDAADRGPVLPFIDGSCRREPDFESPYPSITATCRAGTFAPRLEIGDRVAYFTVIGRYADDTARGWRFVAVLRVIQRFESHDAAADWYTSQSIPLPRNCLVEGNPPIPFHLTNGQPPVAIRARMRPGFDPNRIVDLWDESYRKRIHRWPVFLACKATCLQLMSPPQLRRQDMVRIFGRVPGTQNPPEIERRQLVRLIEFARKRAV